MNDFEFADTLHDTIQGMCRRVVDFYESEDYDEANAILDEWNLSNKENLLTKHLQGTVNTVEDTLLFVYTEHDELAYGEFTFIPDELQIDNN